MNTEAERRVWKLANERYGDGLGDLVVAAITSFRRSPGLDGITRVYQQDIGERPLAVLVEALSEHGKGRFHVSQGGAEIRLRLRSHLVWFLRQALIEDGYAPLWMRDEHFAGDLGI